MFSKIRHYIEQIKNGRIQEMMKQIKWISKYAKNHVWLIVLYTILGMSGTLTGLISSLVSKDLVDIITGHNSGELVITFCTMIGIALVSMLLSEVSIYLSVLINTKVANSIKADIFDVIMNTEWESLSKYHSGELMVRWGSDASGVASGILNLLPNFILHLFRFATTLYMVIKFDSSFAFIAMISIPLSLIAGRQSIKMMQKGNMNAITVNAKLSSFNQEVFSNVQTVKAFDLVPLYTKRLRVLQKEYAETQMHYQRVAIMNSMLMTLVSMVATYSSYGWGVYRVWSGAISYGTMTMFLSLSTSLSATVNNLISLFPNTVALTNSAKRLMELTGMPKEDYSRKKEAREFYEKHSAEGVGLSIRNVTYAYAGGEDVFEGVSVDAHPHEIVAFVGPSGEGKTTMLRYLLSIIRSEEGEGFLCGGNTTPEEGGEVMPLTASTRQLFAYVPQGNTMFSGTIADNMRNVKEDATDEEIIEALKLACAWKFVEKLPEGINSEIKERGGGFSEGQAQRLSIARALLRKSPILLLDEATSALDVGTEREVLRNIMKDEYPRTCIVTTHRPTVLNICNRVYCIQDKKCVTLGKEEIDEMIRDF